MTTTTTANSVHGAPPQQPDAVRELAQALAGDGYDAAARALDGFAAALALAAADPLRPVAVPGWIVVEHDEDGEEGADPDESDDVVVALDPDGLLPLYEELCRIPDPGRLRAAVVLLLNVSVRLQQIAGGAEASAQLMQTAAQLSPVLEAVNGGAPPLVGRAALQLTEDGDGLVLTAPHAQWLRGELELLPADRRRGAVLALAALAEQLGEKPQTRSAAEAVLAVARAAAEDLTGPEGDNA
ncbi:hypothetical protein [Streptomyces sp. S.PB5]|uniref:hypothetical protein n=1 Tax=Streptomyces sp. S.PB5 TaxID=3020844 RepID=UPI0025B0083C|nr:hypothetical protein [Streptomyces sp. S.PB5]MDN3025978.1 hypothetical protein [Streptomyces sp. S.PB5]